MDFESPDVEKAFPGLYASQGLDEDLSDEETERSTKKRDSKSREKKRDRKDKGYKMFEEEDSEEELVIDDTRSPSKMKKHSKPSFKFAKKDKFYKPKDKEKESQKEEKKKEDKEAKKDKLKFKKKKHEGSKTDVSPSSSESTKVKEVKPVFGVPLAASVERSRCHDGVQLPAIFRECIDYVEEFGLSCEGIYRISGVKSKVQSLKDAYNRGQPVYLHEHEPPIIASLLKQFLRDLPDPVLTTEMMPKFEQASTVKNVKQKVEQFQQLIEQLPTPNRLLLSWMIVHMTHVIAKESHNKMSLQNVSIVLSPTMRISHRVLNVFFTYSKILFRDTVIKRYVPPLRPVSSRWSLELPESPSAIEEELHKQESLLNQLHEDVRKVKNAADKEEQLWEVQRVVTQLKRKLKHVRKAQEAAKAAEKREAELAQEKLRQQEAEKQKDEEAKMAAAATAVATTEKAQEEEPPQENQDAPPETAAEPATVGTSETKPENPKTPDEADRATPVPAQAAPASEEIPPEVAKQQQQQQQEQQQQQQQQQQEAQPVFATQQIVVPPQIIAEHQAAQAPGPLQHAQPTQPVAPSQATVIHEQAQVHHTQDGEAVGDTAVAAVVPNQSEEVAEPVPKQPQNEAVRPPQPQNNALPTVEVDGHQYQKLPPEGVTVQQPSAQFQADSIPAAPQQPAQLASEAHLSPMPPTIPKLQSPLQPQRLHSGQPKDPEQTTSGATVTFEVGGEVFHTVEEVDEDTAWEEQQKLAAGIADIALDDRPTMTEKVQITTIEIVDKKGLPTVETREETVMADKSDGESSSSSVVSSPDEETDEEGLQELLLEERTLTLEEEELRAIGDELLQKIETEKSEIERLHQEIAELQEIRDDLYEEDDSDSDSDSSSEDEDELQETMKKLIMENKELEVQNSDLCDKVHLERQICLEVKVQIRLIQLAQAETAKPDPVERELMIF